MKLAATVLALSLAGTAQAEPRFVPANPGAPYSAAVQMGDVLYVSGQLAGRPDGSYPEGMAAQAKQAMDNVAAILKGQNLGLNDVFKCTAFLADMSQSADFNRVYVSSFDPKRLPARSALGASGLPGGSLVEVECWAYAGGRRN